MAHPPTVLSWSWGGRGPERLGLDWGSATFVQRSQGQSEGRSRPGLEPAFSSSEA